MRLDPTLSKAVRLARSGRHEAALRILLPEVTRYDRSLNYYRILGTICLHSGDFGSAHTYLKIAHEIKRRDPAPMLGLAVLFLRRGDTSRAVDLYLEVLEHDRKNPVAKRAMRIIRRQAGTDAFYSWVEAGKISLLYPRLPFPGFSAAEVSSALGIAAAAFAAVFAVMVGLGLAPNPFRTLGPREIPAGLSLSFADRISPVGPGESGGNVLSQSQSIEVYERALALFSDHRDEAARILLNTILESNASDGMRNRARLMLSFLEIPRFDNFKRDDNVSLTSAWHDPLLYRGVHVIWRGIASNVSITELGTSFDFLVGDNAPLHLEGIVPVFFDHAVPLPQDAIEVLGRIETGSGGRIKLEGLATRINL